MATTLLSLLVLHPKWAYYILFAIAGGRGEAGVHFKYLLNLFCPKTFLKKMQIDPFLRNPLFKILFIVKNLLLFPYPWSFQLLCIYV